MTQFICRKAPVGQHQSGTDDLATDCTMCKTSYSSLAASVSMDALQHHDHHVLSGPGILCNLAIVTQNLASSCGSSTASLSWQKELQPALLP
jgi:hypothetical protein